jgi:hypothetical protein
MASTWLHENWFNLLQTCGIVAGLVFSAMTMRRDVEGRRISDQIGMAEQHRELWGAMLDNPKLERVLEATRDLQKEPVTTVEEQFLISVIAYYHSNWLMGLRGGSLVSLHAQALDAGWFFQLPLPAFVWAKVKGTHEPRFREFIEDCVRANASDATRTI